MKIESMLIWPPFLIVSIIISASLGNSCRSFNTKNEIYFAEDTSFLQIPGVGWQTFNRVADEDKSMNGVSFKSGSAYYRWYWATLEPEEGKYAFGMMDSVLAKCRKNGQALAFRFMCEDPWGEGLPQWLIKKAIKRTYSPCPEEGAHYAPDMSDTVFMNYHRKLIKAFGERYNGHPDIALLDIGSVGLWGEWHIYCDTGLMPSRTIRKAITDMYYEYFPETPLTALMNDAVNADYAVSRGNCGWRGDSWGDADSSGGRWNHHEYYYWPTHNRIPDAWETGTIAMEPGEPEGTLKGITVPVKRIVDDAIAWHSTFAHNKSKEIPLDQLPEIERLVKRMGYRMVLKRISYPKSAIQGDTLKVDFKIENKGIAPPYRDYRLAFRLKDDRDSSSEPLFTDLSIKGWLPGEKEAQATLVIPSDIKPGNYNLAIGLVLENSAVHMVPFANIGRLEDGWILSGNLSVK